MKEDTQPCEKSGSIWSCPTCGQSERPPTEHVADTAAPALSKEKAALAIFAAILPRALDKADRKAFPEGSLAVMKLEIAAAWAMADLWISERPDLELE